MHQERNIVESIISMCFDVTGFSKDSMNTRKDLAALCNRPSLEAKTNVKGNLTKLRAPYYLKPTERKEILKWLKKLKFSDHHASNIKRAVLGSNSQGLPAPKKWGKGQRWGCVRKTMVSTKVSRTQWIG
jgi:hypothetical protein